MTSLPMPSCLSETLLTLPPGEMAAHRDDDEQFLLKAFSSFTEAASSLERSYSQLRVEVTRLHHELEESNSALERSLEQNRRMREHLDRILEALPCGVLVVEGSGQILRANPEARRLLTTENLAHPSSDLGSVDSLRGELRHLLDCARDRGGEHERRISADGAPARWVAARHATVPDVGSGASVFILRDVSDGKRLEEAREKLRREQALAEMSAVLAHEIRNPLGSLELFAGLLADSDLSAECRQWVEHMQSGLRTLAATVNNVLHFHSPPQPELSPIDLGELLEWARNFFVPLARRARVEMVLQNHLAGVCRPADRHRLEQVLLNLVLNALRAMPGGGWIRLAGRLEENEENKVASIVVADTGPGIAPEHLDSVFEPGFTTRTGGPGLGLAVCRKIVEQHGGTIHAASRPGAGAVFTLQLPLGRSHGEATA